MRFAYDIEQAIRFCSFVSFSCRKDDFAVNLYLKFLVVFCSKQTITFAFHLHGEKRKNSEAKESPMYRRTSVARTLMAHLPRLFRTHSLVLKNKIPQMQIKDKFFGDFLFYIENGILCVLIRIASMRRF